MSTFDNFKEGQRVAHISIGDGVVAAVDKEFVYVSYDNRARGVYDRQWFEQHPAFLFHRSAPSVPTDK